MLRKLLASSTFAIAGALTSISNRLKDKATHSRNRPNRSKNELDQDYEALDETAEEWDEDQPERTDSPMLTAPPSNRKSPTLRFASLALSIEHNAKGKALLKALDIAFAKAAEIGAAKKAIIFTESRRTQSYLLRVLADSPSRRHRPVQRLQH